ncbi:MAG: quinolinate synthase NadA [Lachnospiraceae bacterium]
MEYNELQKEVLRLKKEKDALILAHYYQTLDVQDIADFVCDSFEMAKKAKHAKNRLIVICGVKFMAESAKILSPDKKVLLPAMDAGCPMADMVEPQGVLELKEKYPDAAVMCYVNSSAEVKAVSDICCTSSSAVRIAKKLDAKQIIFIPDKNLGNYVARQVPEKEFLFWQGYCPTHNKITEEDILNAKKARPNGKFAVHPECQEEVLRHADFIGSTAEIIDFAKNSPYEEIIIGTEMGIVERLKREVPDKKMLSVTSAFVCPNMKKIRLENVRDCLENESNEIHLNAELIEGAKQSLDRMIAM